MFLLRQLLETYQMMAPSTDFTWLTLSTPTYSGLIASAGLSDIGNHFRTGSRETSWTPYIILTVIPIVLAIAITWAYQYFQKRVTVVKSPEKLFREICRLHKLDSSDELLIHTMADASRMADPTELLVFPHRFAAAADTTAAVLKKSQLKKLESLRERLFGIPAGTPNGTSLA